jgi:hypothetical protein
MNLANPWIFGTILLGKFSRSMKKLLYFGMSELLLSNHERLSISG